MACGTTTSPALMPPTTSARSHSRRYRRSQPRAGMTALAVTGATDWNTGSGGAPLLGVREQRPDHRDVEGEHGQRPQRSDEDHEHRQRGADGGEEHAQDLAEGVAAEDRDRGEDLQRPDDEPEPSPGGDVDAVEHVLDRLSLVVLGDGGDAAEDVPDADDADHDGRERGQPLGTWLVCVSRNCVISTRTSGGRYRPTVLRPLLIAHHPRRVTPNPPMAASVRATTRWIVTIVLAVLASLLALVAIVARYARSEVLDTDRYVATVGPLASDPAVQEVVAARVSDRIIGRLDVEELTSDALDALVDAGAPDIVTGLAAPISD